MSNVSGWRDSGHLERAIETAGGRRAFEKAVVLTLDDARAWRLVKMRQRRGMSQKLDRNWRPAGLWLDSQ